MKPTSRADTGTIVPVRNSAEVANYVASICGDLSAIARQHGLETLGFLLDMARLEAEDVTQPGKHHPER